MKTQLMKTFQTQMPKGVIPEAYLRKANTLAAHYVDKNIPLPDQGGHRIFILVRNRYLNLLLAGKISLNTASLNMYVTEEMKLAIYRALQDGDDEAGDYFVAFLSYRISNYTKSHYSWVTDVHDYADLVAALYEEFLLVIYKADLSKGCIPDTYLLPHFKKAVANNLRMRDAFTKNRNSFSTIESIRSTCPDELKTASNDEIYLILDQKGLRTDIPAYYVDDARRSVYSFEVQLDREQNREYSANTLLPTVKDNYLPLYDDEITEMTFSLVRHMDGTLSISDIVLIKNFLWNYFDDEKHVRKISRKNLKLCASQCHVGVPTFEMVMNCYISSLKKLHPCGGEVILSKEFRDGDM